MFSLGCQQFNIWQCENGCGDAKKTSRLIHITTIRAGTYSKIDIEITYYGSAGNILWQKGYHENGRRSSAEAIDKIMKKIATDFPYNMR